MSTQRQAALRAKQRRLRAALFPDVGLEETWDRRRTQGFATIPRAMPLILVLMDELSPKRPVGKTFLALWCRAWDDPLVNIGSRLLEVAIEAGFSGSRATNSLSARLAILQELGFVRFAEGPGGKYSYGLILNPYLILKKHQQELSRMNWNALLSRMNDIGADDFNPPEEQPNGATVRRRQSSETVTADDVPF